MSTILTFAYLVANVRFGSDMLDVWAIVAGRGLGGNSAIRRLEARMWGDPQLIAILQKPQSLLAGASKMPEFVAI